MALHPNFLNHPTRRSSQTNEGVISREILIKQWTDWVDYWAVDFDYESRKEIIKVAKTKGVEGALPGVVMAGEELLEFEERWSGAYIFENEWQSFRTRQPRAGIEERHPHLRKTRPLHHRREGNRHLRQRHDDAHSGNRWLTWVFAPSKPNCAPKKAVAKSTPAATTSKPKSPAPSK